ncbi:Na+/H+ antiporter NhaC family protein [Algoriphagus sp. C2-6-M1]|uniref:YfcC family protein n=1 Tax=Algoriphagus persicinus TaxID=3108754 RepID=UPI002B396074|nr:Na+/H+ antiporter NhaC family protein [Algoriphagus sp. C2-6-M1]MEB2779162.1 Na+/H+ antiporter NhaC family protein [Algoriphagus sp. C2-6-M1]
MKLSFPHPIIILLGFILLAALSSYFVQSGKYDRVLDADTGREIIVPGSFQVIEDQNATIYDVALSIPEGFILGADIVVVILLLGGAFYVVEKTGALQEGIEALIYNFRNRQYLLLYFIGFVFAFCGSTIAMQEELIAMAPVLVLLAKKINYDVRSIIALALGSAIVGASFSPVNPFGSLLSQTIAELDFNEGFAYRLVFLVLAVVFWCGYHIRYGKLKKPSLETYEMKPVKISFEHALILFLTFGGVAVMAWGIIFHDWGYNEMSALFFVVGISCGLIGKLGLNGTARAYTAGFSEMIFAGVIVGLARSVYLILQNTAIIDPLIQAMFKPLESMPVQFAAVGLYISQAIIHIPVPSTSGQAVLTTPLAVPLMDLLGISRQVAVLTYQYAGGLMDLITPTNGGMMAVIAAAGIKFNNWIAYLWKSYLLLMGLGLISVLIALIWFA